MNQQRRPPHVYNKGTREPKLTSDAVHDRELHCILDKLETDLDACSQVQPVSPKADDRGGMEPETRISAMTQLPGCVSPSY